MDFIKPYEPMYVLKSVAENIWIVDGPIIHMQQFGLDIPFPTRMTVILLSDGTLFLHSPIALDEGLCNKLDALGEVKHLVSPNKIHYASIAVWAERYPNARSWASPGVKERAEEHKIPVHFDEDLGEEAPSDWADDIDQLIFHGSRFLEEVVFFHKSSKTVILADLIENMEREKVSPYFQWLLRIGGVLAPDGQLPIDLRMTFLGRHEMARKSLQQMLAYKPERVILAHGAWFETDGEQQLRRAFRWLQSPEHS